MFRGFTITEIDDEKYSSKDSLTFILAGTRCALSRYRPSVYSRRCVGSNTILWHERGEGPPTEWLCRHRSRHCSSVVEYDQRSSKSSVPLQPPNRYNVPIRNSLSKS